MFKFGTLNAGQTRKSECLGGRARGFMMEALHCTPFQPPFILYSNLRLPELILFWQDPQNTSQHSKDIYFPSSVEKKDKNIAGMSTF